MAFTPAQTHFHFSFDFQFFPFCALKKKSFEMIFKTQREHLLTTVEQKDRQYAFQYAWWENVFFGSRCHRQCP